LDSLLLDAVAPAHHAGIVEVSVKDGRRQMANLFVQDGQPHFRGMILDAPLLKLLNPLTMDGKLHFIPGMVPLDNFTGGHSFRFHGSKALSLIRMARRVLASSIGRLPSGTSALKALESSGIVSHIMMTWVLSGMTATAATPRWPLTSPMLVLVGSFIESFHEYAGKRQTSDDGEDDGEDDGQGNDQFRACFHWALPCRTGNKMGS
jgi:hypothetical protein